MARLEDVSDQDRFERLFTEHFDGVLTYALARTDAATADDAVADTFLVAWRRLDEIPESPRAWLLGVTRKTLATQRRSRMRQEAVARRVSQDPASIPELAEGRLGHDTEAASRALAQLSASDRELLCLLAWDGLTQREAAQVLGCSSGTFRVRYFRARRRFGSAIEHAGLLGPIGARFAPGDDIEREEKKA